MIEHYKRLVKLVLQNHSCNAEEESYNPKGTELEAILLASHIREMEDNQNALNQKESKHYNTAPCVGMNQPIYDWAGEIVNLARND